MLEVNVKELADPERELLAWLFPATDRRANDCMRSPAIMGRM